MTTSTPCPSVPSLAGLLPGVEPPVAEPGLREAAERRLRDWVRRYDLTPGTDEWLHLTLGADTAACWPTADMDVVDLSARLYFTFIAVGEVVEEVADGADLARFVHLLMALTTVLEEPGRVPDGRGFDAALADVLRRSAVILSPRHQEDLLASVRSLLGVWHWEAHHRVTRTWPGVDHYLTARRHLSLMWLTRTLAEPLCSVTITPGSRHYDDFLRLKKAATRVMVIHHDLASYAKEHHAVGGVPFSLPGVLMHAHGCDLPSALDRTRRMFTEAAARAVDVLRPLLSSPDPMMRRYADDSALFLVMTDAWYASVAAERYVAPVR
ncbi:hypothetical protein BTM25_47710 [Actinomadura rubteroloni]|uniref:Terpene synthase n=1 Tax=Actinomadura rubteroloni TaxID=1926885 RepID=A0A2P4UF20_9ACTN|nr:terpene synthase family protein [Actinomadura rubteroloni]POM23612.1 hypothetical protein BTM25_47710 [Actinomadura rubteroloni]